MKIKKAAILVALTIAMVVILGACGGGSDSAKSTQEPQAAPPTAVPTRVQPTNTTAPTVAPTATKVPTVAEKEKPTDTPEPQPTVAEETEEELAKIAADQKELMKELSVLDSYKMSWEMKFTIKLKDGTEKTMSMQTKVEAINKPVKKSKLVLTPVGMGDAKGISVISIGDDAWLSVGDGKWMKMPAQQVEGMVSSMLMDVQDVSYISKELRKGTKKIGPLKCTVYGFSKKDILYLAKEYPEDITADDVARIKKIDKMEGETCVTKNGLVLEYHMDVISSDPTNVFGMDYSSFEGVKAEDVKEAVFSVEEKVTDINAKFDIEPPAGG